MSDFPFQRVLITGGNGFLGSYVVEKLRARGCDVIAPGRSEYNLIDGQAVSVLYQRVKPELVIHCAAHCGGIGLNQREPADLLFANLQMGTNLMNLGWANSIRKLINIGTICSYPENTPVPFREEDLWNGYPEPTNAAYGMAKKMLIVQSQAYRQQYGFNSINLLLANLYGPRDNFNLNTSHVIPAIIRKMVEAQATGADSVTLWGTGRPTRDFLHVEDAADAILMAAERYDSSEPVNVGTGVESSIKEIAQGIAVMTGFRGRIEWDKSKPDGQMRRCLNIDKAYAQFGFRAQRRMLDGLLETINWHVSQGRR